MIEATCHCGAVTIRVPRRPRVLTACNCSFCRRTEPLFAYYAARTIDVVHPEGGLESYVWGTGVLAWFRCRTCGVFTHHHPAGREDELDLRSGVNLRLAEPAALDGIEVKVRDGAADTWQTIRRYRLGGADRGRG